MLPKEHVILYISTKYVLNPQVNSQSHYAVDLGSWTTQ